MAARTGVKVAGTGSYLPERVLTNDELARMVDTSDEWIRTRTGISERRIAADDQPTSALAAAAAENALAVAGLTPADIDLILVATISPDKPFPNTACFVQQRIGAENAFCFGLEAACSGFIYGVEVGAAMIRNGTCRTALIIGAEKLSSLVNWTDRTTCVLFGDGAGAAVLVACPAAEDAFIASRLGADGRYTDILHIPAGGSVQPFSPAVLQQQAHYLQMSGQEVFKLAVRSMTTAARETLADAGIGIDDVRWLIPHQANTRIISAVARQLKINPDRAFVNLSRCGNTSAASIPIALDELVRSGQVVRGDFLLWVAFGGGLTWGAQLVRW